MTIRRLYHQVYFETDRPIRNPVLFADIIRTIFQETDVEELEVRLNGTRILTKNDVEIKIGYDPWIQVSAKNQKTATAIANKLIEVIERGE